MARKLEEARRSIGARRNPASADAIRDAAEAVLLESGYSGFSIEAVARRARAGKPTIYRWWPSKAALLLDVYHRRKGIESPDTGNLEEDLFQFLRTLFHHWRETPAGRIFRSIIAEAQSDGAAAEALATYAQGRRAHTAKIIERAKQRGEAGDNVEPLAVADLLASLAWVHLLTDRIGDDEQTIRSAVRILTRGILHEERRDQE